MLSDKGHPSQRNGTRKPGSIQEDTHSVLPRDFGRAGARTGLPQPGGPTGSGGAGARWTQEGARTGGGGWKQQTLPSQGEGVGRVTEAWDPTGLGCQVCRGASRRVLGAPVWWRGRGPARFTQGGVLGWDGAAWSLAP